MTTAPSVSTPKSQVGLKASSTLRHQESTFGVLRRVYVDGLYHWTKDLRLTLCGLPTGKADLAKSRADVECSNCTRIAAVMMEDTHA